jgi:glyoxylase I family protein
MEIAALDHVYLTVSSFERSEAFYDRVMRAFGFFKGDKAIDGERHAHYFNRIMQLTIRPARSASGSDPALHEPYGPGLHHLCLQVPDRAGVDEAFRLLRELSVPATEPKAYPQYNDDYYATFFADPDGIRLEVVARSRHRREIVERWNDLQGFLNPIADLRRRETAARDRGDRGD